MTVLLVLTAISAAAVTFLVHFFIAICKDNTGRTGRVERISPAPIKRNGESKVLYMKSTTMGTQAACNRR